MPCLLGFDDASIKNYLFLHIKINNKKIMSCLQFGKKTLRSHQIRVIKTLFDNFSVLAAHGTGTGKTLTSIGAAECLLHLKKVTHVIVAAPRALVDNFWKELLSYTDFVDVDKYTVATYQGIQKKFLQDPGFFKNAFLIVDEAHNLRTFYKVPRKQDGKIKGKMAYDFIKMSMKVNKVLLLTATPLVNRVTEFINLYHMLIGDGKTESENKFIQRLDRNGCPLDKKIFQRLIDIHQRNIQDENFPIVKQIDEVMIMTGSYLKDYEDLEKRIDDGVEPVVYMMKLRQLVNKMGNEDINKIAFVLDKLTNNRKKKLKTVIFSQFLTNGILLITSYLEKKNIPFFLITGKTKKNDIKVYVEDFNKKKRGGILFISKAGGEGLDLKGVRAMILMEPFWNESNEVQAIGRGVRFKSHTHLPSNEQNVKIFRLVLKKPRKWLNLFTKPSVDEYLIGVAKQKQKNINSFLNCLK